jgi:hypothetical protein
VPDLAEFGNSLDGELFSPDAPGYEAIRRPVNHVRPNFPDLALDDWAVVYRAGNYPRLAAVKNAYEPHRFFDFPQAI